MKSIDWRNKTQSLGRLSLSSIKVECSFIISALYIIQGDAGWGIYVRDESGWPHDRRWAFRSACQRHTQPSPAHNPVYNILFLFFGQKCVLAVQHSSSQKGTPLYFLLMQLLFIIYSFFFLVFILYSYIFLYGYDNKRAAVPLFGSTPHSIVERETVGGGTPSVMFLARGSTPNILYTYFFLFFLFFIQLERERYFSIGCAGHHVQEPKPKKDPPPPPPPYHHPWADDDDQQQSKRVIDIIHIRQVPKGGKEIKKTNHTASIVEIVQPPLIIISTKRI